MNPLNLFRPGAYTLLGLVFAQLVVQSCLFAADPPAPVRPNLVFIVVDDLGYGDLGCYGGREIPTPHLDALAAGGVRFTQGYVTASYCAPSRAALLTGQYQTRFGFEGNPTGALNADPRIGLPVTAKTLADRVRTTGYATGLVGKWHLGGTPTFHPQRRGFDEFFGFLHEGHTYVAPPWNGVTSWLRRTALPDGGKGRWTSPDGRIVWTTHMGNNEPDYNADNPLLRDSQPVNENAHLTEAFTREACDFITRHQAQPFFLYLAYNAVHSPLQADNDYLERFRHIPDIHRRIFAALLAQVDEGIGAVVARLRETGLERDTLVVFLSDNGGATRELTSSNAPLRGEKGSLYEGGLRVPMLMRWPARFPTGHVVETPVISVDITATALAAARVTPDPAADGIDLIPFLSTHADPPSDRTFYWRAGARAALRTGPWKLVREPIRGQPGPWQLYHIDDDIGEKTNLVSRDPARLAELTERWNRWSAAQASPLW
ncbi:MAG: sulfatase-like hydrolase/transferase [Opitutaceae bacterium]|nr:sulfatase-like hydrolase/transferase [Opitutaceae bacterium]